jgi:hypothetical protein
VDWYSSLIYNIYFGDDYLGNDNINNDNNDIINIIFIDKLEVEYKENMKVPSKRKLLI